MDCFSSRCLIDADGTLFKSLVLYNKVIDSMFYPIAKRPYESYLHDFGDRYMLIPGAPWQIIIPDLVEYLTGDKPSDNDVASLILEFNEKSADVIFDTNRDDLIIWPTIEFAERYKDAGGRLSIHSGTNQTILEAMLDRSGIRDLFDRYVTCDQTLPSSGFCGEEDYWGYKRRLIGILKEGNQAAGRTDFVVGDTNGDCFGGRAFEAPFGFVWRGYHDPNGISNKNGGIYVPDFVLDARDSVIDDFGMHKQTLSAVNSMVKWASGIGK